MDSEGECPSGLASRRVILTEEQDVNKNQGLAGLVADGTYGTGRHVETK